jgi:L-fucose mutarotase
VKTAHAVIQTGEPRLYANIILRKGVIYPKEPGVHGTAGVDPFVY